MPVSVENREPESLFEKILNYACWDNALCVCCRECCRLESNNRKPKLTKDDIHPIINQQPLTMDPIPYSSCSSPRTPISRDRFGSDNSSQSEDSLRRAGSTSSHGSDYRRQGATPIIDMKPIEFWAANNQAVQPRAHRRRLPSESEISVDDLKVDLYSSVDSTDECLTDEQKLQRFKLGQIHFSLQYEIPNNSLFVKIIEARDLPPPVSQDANRQDMAHSNPYTKLCLLPDQKNSHQTSVQRKTQEPIWGEMFKFELPFAEVQRRTLEITVKDFDKFSRHCVIGQVHLPLEGANIVKGGHMWKPLMPCHKSNPDLGEILLSLNYLPTAGRLNVDVMKAKQLLQADMLGDSDPYVKITVAYNDKWMKTRKTSIKKSTIDPVFNESFHFNVNAEQLHQCCLVVTVWDKNCKSKDDFVGRIVMGRQSTGSHEVTHWNRMLQCHRSPVAQWHTLRLREDCDLKCPISSLVS